MYDILVSGWELILSISSTKSNAQLGKTYNRMRQLPRNFVLKLLSMSIYRSDTAYQIRLKLRVLFLATVVSVTLTKGLDVVQNKTKKYIFKLPESDIFFKIIGATRHAAWWYGNVSGPNCMESVGLMALMW